MMPPRKRRSGRVVMAAAAAPILFVGAARLLTQSAGPSSADAAVPADVQEVAAPLLTPEQLGALAFQRAKMDRPFGSSPFYEPVKAPLPAQTTASTPGVSAPPEVAVTSVMSHKSGAMCIINGKVRRVGDMIAPGWRLDSIDADAGQVVIVSIDGRKVTSRLRAIKTQSRK